VVVETTGFVDFCQKYTNQAKGLSQTMMDAN
jgi:hypothetical protein